MTELAELERIKAALIAQYNSASEFQSKAMEIIHDQQRIIEAVRERCAEVIQTVRILPIPSDAHRGQVELATDLLSLYPQPDEGVA